MSILEKFSLKNKVAIVTGSSTGLGQGVAIALAQAGADVAGVDYVDQPETKAKVEALGRKYLSIKADLIANANPEFLKGLVANVVKEFGKVDILVNNAGIIRREDALNFSEKDWDDVMDINIKTVFFLSQAVANQYVAQKSSGKIISIASMLAFQGGVRVPSYTASKSGVKGVTMLMANEWAKYGINANAIAPGYMATNNTAQLRDDETRSGQILERIPAGRWGTPEDIAGAAVFLASEASDYVNGFTLAVDGGWLAR
ncbi:3-oxoacyl-(acyl-carrier-protein) reductase [Alteracholeplasma palmae J233]|uniref:2-dehydro-3-deoxy-D-gluconate 5-dehydrogenase n=1 Tax=Alteracholeplasma palmae (strain ATCC 49389 / J233) TaxID=1318466 RepID=U4KRI9_ALTPJ|nr:2-dehydro-3-deoxy-D-gluconate 5-dehydrogenase KduD [Alteracholeplasma palmae]CCV64206.1 3-oxoacyl-(acyl-carrier-protein) reductase [Alteracholeplasma palmae J233]